MKMTKAQFVTLAQVIKYKIHLADDRKEFVQAILPMLYKSNPKFDAAKFVEAANVPELL